MDSFKKWVIFRIKLVAILFTIVFTILIARAFYMQVYTREKWLDRAQRQHQRVIEINAKRGEIVDRNHITLAIDTVGRSFYIEPLKLDRDNDDISKISEATKIDTAIIDRLLNDNNDKNFIYITRRSKQKNSSIINVTHSSDKRLRHSTNSTIESGDIDGFGYINENARDYPWSHHASNVIGFTGVDHEGLEGIEFLHNDKLSPKTGLVVFERDALGRSLDKEQTPIISFFNGDKLQLNIDILLTKRLDDYCIRLFNRGQSNAIFLLLANIDSDEIFSITSIPNFNPNDFRNYNKKNYLNRNICQMFAPSSLYDFLALTNSGYIKNKDIFFEEKSISDIKIIDHKKILNNYKINYRINKSISEDANFKQNPFGKKLNIDFPGQDVGFVMPAGVQYRAIHGGRHAGDTIISNPLQLADFFIRAFYDKGVVPKILKSQISFGEKARPTLLWEDNFLITLKSKTTIGAENFEKLLQTNSDFESLDLSMGVFTADNNKFILVFGIVTDKVIPRSMSHDGWLGAREVIHSYLYDEKHTLDPHLNSYSATVKRIEKTFESIEQHRSGYGK